MIDVGLIDVALIHVLMSSGGSIPHLGLDHGRVSAVVRPDCGSHRSISPFLAAVLWCRCSWGPALFEFQGRLELGPQFANPAKYYIIHFINKPSTLCVPTLVPAINDQVLNFVSKQLIEMLYFIKITWNFVDLKRILPVHVGTANRDPAESNVETGDLGQGPKEDYGEYSRSSGTFSLIFIISFLICEMKTKQK